MNQKTSILGIRQEIFILTRTVECGLEAGDLGGVYYGCTGGEIGIFKTLINKGFPDIEFFPRQLCRGRLCQEILFFIFRGNISTTLKAIGLS